MGKELKAGMWVRRHTAWPESGLEAERWFMLHKYANAEKFFVVLDDGHQQSATAIAFDLDNPEYGAPFDLQQALAGAKLVTRDGREIRAFGVDPSGANDYLYSASVEGARRYYTIDGVYDIDEHNHPFDLLIAEPVDLGTIAAPAPQSILAEADGLINGDRQEAYGSVADNFGRIAAGWSQIFGCEVSPQQVGLAMAWLKIARQVHKPQRDNLVDGAGYLGLVEKLGV